MFIPNCFYYYPTESREQFSTKAQGDISIDRLLQNKPDYWLNPAPARVQKKKKLILGNTIAGHVAHYNIAGPLIAEGFELYVWENKKIRRVHLPLTREQFAKRSMEDAVFPEEIIKEAWLQHHWNSDEIQIVDNYWVDCLVQKSIQEHTAYVSNLKATSYFSDRTKNNPYLVSGRLITHIADSEFSKFINEETIKLKQAFPLARMRPYYTNLELDAFETVNFFRTTEQNKNYSLGGSVFTPQNLIQIRELILNLAHLKEKQSLGKILKKAQRILKLKISEGLIDDLEDLSPEIVVIDFINITINQPPLRPGGLPKTTRLSLLNCRISGENLKKFLAATPTLRHLVLTNCIINNVCDLPDLNHLEEIRIDVGQKELIQYVLKRAPKLTSLILVGPDSGTITSYVHSLGALLKPTTKAYAVIAHLPAPTFNALPDLPQSLKAQSQDELNWDADTQSNPNQKYPVQRIFYSVNDDANPSPTTYRLNVFQDIEIKDQPCSIQEAFKIKKKGDLQLRPCEVPDSPKNVYELAQKHRDNASQAYYGKQKLVLSSEWQAIASLSPEDRLLAYHLEPTTTVELAYSQRDNLYYVRSKTDANTEVTLNFAITIPKIKRPLPAPIEDLVTQYLTFKDGALAIAQPNPTGKDYLHAIQEQGKGVCRHRALAFKAEMQKKYPQIPVRIINNDCHSTVEIYSEGHWEARNLGGSQVQLIINDNDPLPQPATPDLPPDTSFEGRYLETWKKEEAPHESVNTFCQKIMNPATSSKKLIELSSVADVNALSYLLQRQAHHSNQDILYIHSPEELVCAAPWITRKEEGHTISGELKEGPGGRLYDFLMKAPRLAPRTLLINYANFNAEDTVKLNTILDTEAQIDGVSVPKSVRIVGLTNTQGDQYYSGEDFYSRFNDIVPAPPSATLTTEHQLHVKEVKQRTAQDTQVTSIRLFHSTNWKNDLLGQWIMDGKQIRFEEGLLQKALLTGLPLLIHQGLWDDDEFVNFWHQAKLLGYIEHSGGVLKVPANLQLLREDAYDWSYLTKNIQSSDHLEEPVQFLNPSTFSNFFNHYTCDNNTQSLKRRTGLIDAASKTATKTLSVYLTRDLTVNQWAKLGHACQEQGIALRVHLAPGLTLLKELPLKPKPANITWVDWDKSKTTQQTTTIIQSTDIDTTVTLLTADSSNWLVLDISECKGDDLLTHINGSFDAQALSFKFTETNQALSTALKQGKKIILKGHFTPELLDELAPLLQQRMKEQGITTPLVLVGTQFSQGHYLTTQMKHQVSTAEKESCLNKDFSVQELSVLTKKQLETESLARLKARLIHQRTQPGRSTDEAWAGLTSLPATTALSPLKSTDNTVVMAKAFHQQRKNQLMLTLKHAPYAYLTGLTGTGKSTFVARYIQNDPQIHFYTSLKEWALDKTHGKMKLFFEDESNLNPRQWHELEGLFNNPPGILIEGTYYPLTPEHKVLMAGNPISYGDERQLSPVFERHGNALVFEALPLACVYEDLLKPVFAGTDWARDSFELCKPFLDVYQFLLAHSAKKLLISPRELQMMAVLTWSHLQQAPKDNIFDVACYYAQQVTQDIVPPEQRKAYFDLPFMQHAQRFAMNQPPPHHQPQADFLLTPSRIPIFRQLTNLLALNELRKQKAGSLNHSQLYGGLGGLIMTGDVGIGKSEIAIAALRQRGYKEQHFKSQLATKPEPDTQLVPAKIFYRMPAGLPLKVKKQLILKAFDEGAILVADEINSSALLERWFNDLLMGKHPLTGKPAKIPGFALIGSQNPVTMKGRRNASPAAERRLLQVAVSAYPHQEMVDILMHKGISAPRAKHLVTVFETKRAYALKHHLKPPPVFRNLLKCVDLELQKTYQNNVTAFERTISTLSDDSIRKNAPSIKEIIGQISSPVILKRLTQIGFFDVSRAKDMAGLKQGIDERISRELSV